MPTKYPTRSALRSPPTFPSLGLFDDFDQEFEATSTIGRTSSPPHITDDESTRRLYVQLAGPPLPESDEDEADNLGLSPAEKAIAVLKHMRTAWPRFSLRTFILTLFTSNDAELKGAAGIFIRDGGVLELLQVFWELSTHWQRGKHNQHMAEWVVERAGEVIGQEFSWMTNRASEGPHYSTACRFRVSAEDATVNMVRNFKLSNLTAVYDETTPFFQQIL